MGFEGLDEDSPRPPVRDSTPVEGVSAELLVLPTGAAVPLLELGMTSVTTVVLLEGAEYGAP